MPFLLFTLSFLITDLYIITYKYVASTTATNWP